MPTILPPGGTIFTQHSGRPLRQGCRFFLHRSEHPCNTPDRGRHRNRLRDQERSECDKRSSLPKTPLGNIRFFPSKPGRKGTLCQPLRCRGRSRPVRSAVPAPSTPRRNPRVGPFFYRRGTSHGRPTPDFADDGRKDGRGVGRMREHAPCPSG